MFAIRVGICVLALLAPALAAGVCFAPNTTTSGYGIPLEEEVRSSTAIVVGDVSSIRELYEDRAEPGEVTAFVYTIQVSRWLKSRTPRLISIRAENDSGGYRMELGQRHLLLLTRSNGNFAVDECGNSSPLPQGQSKLVAAQLLLAGSPQP